MLRREGSKTFTDGWATSWEKKTAYTLQVHVRQAYTSLLNWQAKTGNIIKKDHKIKIKNKPKLNLVPNLVPLL